MGFLKSLFGGRDSTPPAPQPSASTPTSAQDSANPAPALLPKQIYTGMKMEVMTTTNSLLFVGKVTVRDGFLELRTPNEAPLPQAIYNQEIKLRGYAKNAQILTMYANVCRNGGTFWHVENVRALQISKENRSFFRQTAELPGNLFPSGSHQSGSSYACTVLDISGNGARVRSVKEYPEGAMLRLDVTVLPEEPPFSITCQVIRITTQKSGWEYGCSFVGLPEREQNRLLQSIFVLQRKALKRE